MSAATVTSAPTSRSTAALQDAALEQGLDAGLAHGLARALEDEGRLLDALDMLLLANRLARDPETEREIVRLRRAAYAQLDLTLTPRAWPPFAVPGDTDRATGPLEIRADAFDADALARGVLRHGHLLVRGLVPPGRVARLREVIDQAFAAREAVNAGHATPETRAWYDPVPGVPDGDTDRGFVDQLGGLFTADSPRALFEFLETVRDLGILRMVEAYLGERPAMSVKKGTLRRIGRPVPMAGWHQDGAFLGTGIRSINMWTALTSCGKPAPGMEIVPVKLDRIVPQLGDGGPFAWTVPPATIARELPGVEIWKPDFEPGDVLFFDHWSLHRTAVYEAMPAHARYAIESWFFAPSAYARDAKELFVV